MNTETRLRDALGAAARTMPDDARGPGLVTTDIGRPVRARRWPFVALAAAAVVLLAVIVPQAVLRSRQAEPTGPASGAPPYFVAFGEGRGDAGVYDSKTGRRTATIPALSSGGRAGFIAVAAAPDQRTYYLTGTKGACDTSEIIRVVLRDDGTVRDNRAVRGGGIEGRLPLGLAVSQDGRKLAISTMQAQQSGDTCKATYGTGSLAAIDLTTGERRTWGVNPGTAREVSWAPDNRTLAFLWIEEGNNSTVRLLDTAKPAGGLKASRPVPGKPANQMDLAITADGRYAQVVRWGKIGTLDRIDLRTGKVTVVDDRLEQKGATRFVTDATREHLLVLGSIVDDSNQVVSRRAGRYENGRVDWFKGQSNVTKAAW